MENMTAIQRTEIAIHSGVYMEPVARFRVYCLIMSPTHLAYGTDFMLAYSAETKDDAEQIIEDYCRDYDTYIIVDGNETREAALRQVKNAA